MNLLGISINHKTASIKKREALHLNRDSIVKMLPELKKNLFFEGFILSTCNRTEIFGSPHSQKITFKDVEDFLLNHKPIEGITSANFESYYSCSAIRHIFTVASGLDSLIVGDSQILGQVKEAFRISVDNNFTGPLLKKISDSTLKVGKRAIKETRIGDGAVTISYAAVQVVEKIFSYLEKKSALVIGAGETGQLAAVHLRDKNIGKIAIANRTLSKAEVLANKVNGKVIPFENLNENFHSYDIIISATSSPDILFGYDEFKQMMKKRKNAPCCIMDIALPRDIDSKVKKIDNIFYNDIDSLNVIVKNNLEKRKTEIPEVQKIIVEEMVNLFSWYNTLEIVPTIKSFRNFFEDIRQDELQKIHNKVTDEDFEKLDVMTRRMIGRILHNPTIKLKNMAKTGQDTQEAILHAALVKELFDLDNMPENGHKEDED